MLKWLFGGSSRNDTKPAEPAPQVKPPAPETPARKDYNIFRGPSAVVAAFKTAWSEYLPLPDENGRPLIRDGKPAVLKTSGIAFNTTTLSGFIKSMERCGHDMAHHRQILEELKAATANAGLTEQMAKVRLTGYLIGEPENGNVILRNPLPTDMKGRTVTCLYPAIERPGFMPAMTIKL